MSDRMPKSRPIYLDYAATTPVDPRVCAVMAECLGIDGDFGNPASNTHFYGFAARARVEAARAQLANLLNLPIDDPQEIIFTSGATESNNLALKGFLLEKLETAGLITMVTEHKAVLDPAKYLSHKGLKTVFLKPDSVGLLDLNLLEAELKSFLAQKVSPILVSVMWVNNETGVIQDVKKIAALVKSYGAYLHIDAAQAVGKLDVDLKNLPVDMLSISAHKFYGPKGIGALFVRRKPKINLSPLIHGGGHERGLRSGTLATHQIVGMGLASEIATHELVVGESQRLLALKEKFLLTLGHVKEAVLEDIYINGVLENTLPGILNIEIRGVDNECLILSVQDQLAISAGSACTSTNLDSSHVLAAMGRSDRQAHESIRVSFGRFTLESQVERAAILLQENIIKLRAMVP